MKPIRPTEFDELIRGVRTAATTLNDATPEQIAEHKKQRIKELKQRIAVAQAELARWEAL
jgi:uncharacterized small protein (DUF1192 family)